MATDENRKRSFFDELYQLDLSDDSVNDVGSLLASLRAAKPAQKSRLPPQLFNRRRTGQHQVQHLGRAVLAPSGSTPTNSRSSLIVPSPADNGLSSEPTTSPVTPSQIVGTVQLQHQPAAGPQTKIAPLQMAPTTKKRKRDQSLELLPEAQQIFRGLRFYFLPNDDVAPARRLRISKVLERGATWRKQFDDEVTHVILDRGLAYNDLLKYLKRSSIPSGISVVNEYYPAECIQFRTLLNPDQALYHVQGYPQKILTQPEDSTENSSAPSLQLKPEKRASIQPSPTPTRTESSQQTSVDQTIFIDTTTVPLEGARDVYPLQGKAHSCSTEPQTTEPGLSYTLAGATHLPHPLAVPSSPSKIIPPTSKPRDQPTDALDYAIQEVLAVKDLPLDDEDTDDLTSSMMMDDSDNDNSQMKPKRIKAKESSSRESRQAKFICMEKHTDTENQTNPNARTIEVLKQMTDYYDRTNDHWRTIAYRKAIGALKKQNRKITTKEEAFAIPFIGQRLATKIEEIVFTNRLRRLENTNFDATDAALQLFLGIYGVGHSQASQWINAGYRTLEDLKTKATLTKNQKIGIDHMDDFATRITRKQVEHHGQIVRDAIAKADPNIQVTIGGSYRRGAPDSGDVDFLISHPHCSMETLRTVILETVIPSLFTQSYLRHTLASTSRTSGSKWHGCATLPGSNVWHRVDFLLVPNEEIGAALIYFTGNDIFNRSLRLLASRMGMRLNQRGLWRDVLRGEKMERVTEVTLVEGRDERRIFEVLGVPWRGPEERIC
ncbi:MAG: hypothetical protein Q9223_005376 [Gallowayella weberi]